jgi:cell division initiation protein
MLTPTDIEKKEFTKGVRGYKDTEVDAFLDEIIEEFKNLTSENRNLKDRILRSNSDYEKLKKEMAELQTDYDTLLESNRELGTQYRELESRLYTTLESAKTLMSDISASAEKKAQLLVENAQIKADEIISSTKQDLAKLKQQEKLLKDRVISARMRFQYLLESELKSLKILDTDVLGEKVVDEFDEFLNSIDEGGKE